MELVVPVAAAVAVAALVSPAVLASYVALTTPRYRRRRLPPLMLAWPTTSSRMPILPITRTAPLSDHMLHMQIMDMLNWRPRSLSSPSLFRYIMFYVCITCDCALWHNAGGGGGDGDGNGGLEGTLGW